jgi:hypothetical protein
VGRRLRPRLGRAEAWIRNAALGRSAVHLLSAVAMAHEASPKREGSWRRIASQSPVRPGTTSIAFKRPGIMAKPQTCPECSVSMEEGVTLDLETRRAQTWLRGPVEEKRLAGIKTRGKELLRVVSYRCPKCGYLKTFAPPV